MKLSKDNKENIEIVKRLGRLYFQEYPILQIITVAQAILESGLTLEKPSGLAFDHCNLFGMKPGRIVPMGTNGVVSFNTKECDKYSCWTEKQMFLSNHNIEDSFAQHELLFTRLPRYAIMFKAKTFPEANKSLGESGYATDQRYFIKLLNIRKTVLGDY